MHPCRRRQGQWIDRNGWLTKLMSTGTKGKSKREKITVKREVYLQLDRGFKGHKLDPVFAE